MEKFKELVKRSFDLFVKKRWLKEIDKCLNSYNKSKDKAERDKYVLAAMLEEYNKLYPTDRLHVKTTEQAKSKYVKPTAKPKWIFWEGWMSNHDMRIDNATCSVCGYKHPTVRRTHSAETEQDVLNKLGNFCPNCGKPMERNLYNES